MFGSRSLSLVICIRAVHPEFQWAASLACLCVQIHQASIVIEHTLSFTGAGLCDNDINAFCPKIKPGELRLSECLSNQLAEEDKGNVEGMAQDSI